jgi:hypothetical protein
MNPMDVLQLSMMNAPWAIYVEADGCRFDDGPFTEVLLWECSEHSLVVRNDGDEWKIHVATSVDQPSTWAVAAVATNDAASDESEAELGGHEDEFEDEDEDELEDEFEDEDEDEYEDDEDEDEDEDDEEAQGPDLSQSISALWAAMVGFREDSIRIREATQTFLSVHHEIVKRREEIALCAVSMASAAELLVEENRTLREQSEVMRRQLEDARRIVEFLALGLSQPSGHE